MTRYRRAPGIGVIEDESVVYVAHLPDGPIMVLEEGSAAVWLAASSGTVESITDRVVALTGEGGDEIRPHVESFLNELLRRGLLAREPGT